MKVIATIFAILLILLVAFTGWKVERYFNWKFGYKGKVEARIEQLEKRITALENHTEK